VSRKHAPPPLGDAWFDSEELTRRGMVLELRRIAFRFRVRPWPALLLALLVTAGISYKFLNKPKHYEANVVLALTEGQQFSGKGGIPFDQLRGYVTSSLMPDGKLLKLIEDRNLYRLRARLGPQWAVDQLRGQIDVEIWKNSFIYYDEEDYRSRKTARIGISVADGDPDRATLLARDIASIVIETHEEQRRQLAAQLATKIAMLREELSKKLSDISMAVSIKQTALAAATRAGDTRLAATLYIELAALAQEEKDAEVKLSQVIKSPDTVADRLTAAGLGMRLDVVEERRPDRPEQSWLTLVLTLSVVGAGALVGAALFLGAFDSRVHDTDDVARLGLPVLGHVPGFPGDQVGSLRSRGARRNHVPWFLRWRSRP
jgi:hypothetical protein